MAALVVGGTGDLQQAARTGNTVACGFFRPIKDWAFTGSP